MLPRYFPTLLIINVVLAVIAIQNAMVQVQSNVMIRGTAVLEKMISLAAEINAMQTGK